MNKQDLSLSFVRWRQSAINFRFLKYLGISLLSSFGVLWLMVEITSFFSEDAQDWLSTQAVWFFAAGIVISLYLSRPKRSIKKKLSNRDVLIEICISDIFDLPGAIIIPTNTTFDTQLAGRISEAPSVQGRFTQDYYGGIVSHLDKDIEDQLLTENYPSEDVTEYKPGKQKRFDIGTVVALRIQGRLFYLLSLTDISKEGLATGNEDDLKFALNRLWIYLREKGYKGNIVIPVIGTDHARIPITREAVIEHIVYSFIDSISSSNYCNHLTIAIYPPDVVKYDVNLTELEHFLECACTY